MNKDFLVQQQLGPHLARDEENVAAVAKGAQSLPLGHSLPAASTSRCLPESPRGGQQRKSERHLEDKEAWSL